MSVVTQVSFFRMLHSRHTDIMHPKQLLDTTVLISSKGCFPEVGPLIYPAPSLDQLISRLDPSEDIIFKVIQGEFL